MRRPCKHSTLRRRGQHADLLQHTRDVGVGPVFDDLAVADAVDRDAFGLDLSVRRGDAKEFSRVHATAENLADDEITFRDLHPDLMNPGSGNPKDLRRLLHSLTVEADSGNRRIVRDEVLCDVLVKDAPVARVIVLDASI